MRFYKLGEIPTRGDDEVFKASAMGPFFWFIVVQVLPGGIVRVRWNGTSPSARKAIEYLGRQVKVADAVSTQDDLTDHRNLSPAEADAKILKLARSGDKMGAVTLTRQIYGSTLSEAKALVDRLLSGG